MIVVVVAAGSLVTGTAPAGGAAPGADPHARWVTLVTGDRVLVRPSGADLRLVTVEPGKGRRAMRFNHRTRDGWHYVVPADAEALVAANVIDKRLFNVSLLLRWGYDDRGRDTLPLLVAGGTAGLRSERAMPSIGAAAVTLEKAGATQFWAGIRPAGPLRALAGGVTRIWLDGKVEALLDRTVPQIGAPAAWQSGYTGAGVTVAVLDSGIDTTHPDLAGAVVGERDFTGSATGPRDLLGHGTHVAGIITGDGTASGGRYQGVAPDATLLNAKVLRDDGFGRESWLIAGMEWAVAEGARIVSMSLGASFGTPADPMAEAVDRLTRQTGTLFVVAAGNSGPGEDTINSPGTADLALTVGAVDGQDAVAGFSSRGPRQSRAGIKPDLMAPGVGVVSALAPGSLIAKREPVVDGHYVALSGTSMATPHVSGAAALLVSQHPDWRAERLKGVLMGSATALDGASVHTQGTGRVDVARAVRQPVFVTPSSVDVGVALWPHGDDQPIDTTLTYHNDGDAPVTLDLSPRMRGPAGDAPAGMFTVTPAELVVPARGTATARLTSDTRVEAPDGRYEGTVVATGGGTEMRVPVALVREVESYDVTVTGFDGTGAAPYELLAGFAHVDTGDHHVAVATDGVGRVRIPRGTYFVVATISTPIGDGFSHVLTAEPAFVVDGPRTLVVDARKAKPVAFRLDRPDAAFVGQCLIGFFRTMAGQVNSDETIGRVELLAVIPSSTSAPADQFTYQVIAQAGRSDGNGGFTNSPYSYLVNWTHPGSIPADLTPRIRDADLARVTHRIATSGPDQRAWFGPVGPLAVPGTITQLVSPGLPSQTPVGVYVGGRGPDDGYPDIAYYPASVTYRPGDAVQRRWNVGVFAPTLIDDYEFVPYLARSGNRLWAGVPLFGSGVGGQAGTSATDTMRLALFKDGTLIGESPYQAEVFEVPDDPGAYRLESTATRSVSTLSTHLSAAWTFRSSKVDEVLPLLAVGFRPQLDEHNRARAGRLATFPVSVSQAPGANAGQVTALTVDFSFDDGRTWHPARVTGSGADRWVTVVHPPGVPFVSLRAKASSDRGVTAELTVVRAYSLR
ncbi:S8 family peptidase [Allorhizocola rhizosphaerae]|uniref:S8 family peptidase n=1 Tax=Allorhizocola rhizosphaerae TaxID=1872709 RepID=UPI0013C2F0FD|nr:S8 family peptidase [Allorhizocola rhizosphaerae]